MIIKNVSIVLENNIIKNGYVETKGNKIVDIKEGKYSGQDNNVIDGKKQILMPGFVDIHFHGACGVDFMDASEEDFKTIAKALYQEGVTTFLATTLTSDYEALKKVCQVVKNVKNDIPSFGGIHFEGPYINAKHKGAQNEEFIRNPDIKEFKELNKISGNNVRYISLAPEKEGAMKFIKEVTKMGVTVSAGHTDATFDQVKEAIDNGLTNTTHTHNAMSGHHHRNPGVVTAAMYFDELYTEVICDTIHVCPNTLKAFYKIVTPERFVMITDSLKAKYSNLKNLKLFGLDCEIKNGAAYLLTGPLAGSLLSMDRGLRNMKEITNASLVDLAKITSRNAAKSIHFENIGIIKKGYNADFVLLDKNLMVSKTFKNGIEVFSK